MNLFIFFRNIIPILVRIQKNTSHKFASGTQRRIFILVQLISVGIDNHKSLCDNVRRRELMHRITSACVGSQVHASDHKYVQQTLLCIPPARNTPVFTVTFSVSIYGDVMQIWRLMYSASPPADPKAIETPCESSG